ncbi:MAG TPA: AI-2E family transporter [Ktedonobacteraceae bacterium]|nr:AI-2E family transporter [Ktedonobacteraceae bacterium]
MNRVNWREKRDMLICVICFGIIIWAGWNLLNQFVEAVLLLLLSMAIAFLITPAVNFLVNDYTPRLVATLIVYIVGLVVIGAIGYLLIFSLVNQVQQFSNTIISFFSNLPTHIGSLVNLLERGGIPKASIDTAITQVQNQVEGFATAAALNAVNIVLLLTNAFLNILIIIVISFYLTLDGKRIRDSIVNVIPRRSRPTVLLFEDALDRVVGNYIRGQLVLALIVGGLTTLVCVVTGLGQFALIFGFLGFLFETIPMVGPGLASIAPIVASLLLPGPFPRTLIIIACFIGIQAIESNILGPRIVGHAVGLHPVVSIMALLIFARLFGSSFGAFGGAVGALVATPIVAAAWVVIASIYRSMRGETAEQIMAHKRAPWELPHPTLVSRLRRRPPGVRGEKPEAARGLPVTPQEDTTTQKGITQEEYPLQEDTTGQRKQ